LLADSISPDYQELLDLLGSRLDLLGHTGYNGGLDVSAKLATGPSAIFRDLKTEQSPGIMYHVSALIPSRGPADPTRKRHIGNDVVVVVFNESGRPFHPSVVMKSHFTHVYVVIEKVKPKAGDSSAAAPPTKYKVEVVLREGVALVPPYLPVEPVFVKASRFEQWLICKCTCLLRFWFCYFL